MGDATFVDTTSLKYSRSQPSAPVKLTPARRRALLVLMGQHHKGRSARVSNTTDADDGFVYWQSAEWLVAAGLARPIRDSPTCSYLRITQAGLDRLAAENAGIRRVVEAVGNGAT